MAIRHNIVFRNETDPMADPKDFPSDRADKFVVRFPDGMRDQIAEAAKANGRSMNAEIIHRLQVSLASESLVIDDDAQVTADDAATALALMVLDKFGNSKDRAQAAKWKERIAIEDKTVLLRGLEAAAPQKTVKRVPRTKRNKA